IDERFENGYRTKIRIIAQQLAEIEQAVLALLAGRQVIVFRIPYRSQKDRGRFQAEILSRLRQRLAVAFDGNATDVGLYEFKFVVVLAGDDFQNPAGFSKHFRADAITGQPRYARFHVWKSNPDLQLS